MQDIGATKLEMIGDKSINFRPSPNFKHMKKYLKSKFEEAASSGNPEVNLNIDQEYPKKEDKKTKIEFPKEVDNKTKIYVKVQPPLPPGTPPPDYPPNFESKKEVIDDGYEYYTSQQLNNTESEFDKTKVTEADTTDKPKKIMCKDFVRGKCKRTPCNYNHELDLTQLKGVYKFCRDFANGKCSRPVCFFVHATTFEKENFFRTGVLPPHTLSHLKDSPVAQQLQPASKVSTQLCKPNYPVASANPTHSEYNSCALSLPPVMTVPPAAPVDPGTYSLFPQPQQSPPKLVWTKMNGVAREAEEEVPKKCINCELAEISYQQKQSKLECIEKSTYMLKENILTLERKKAKLMAVLTKILWKDIPNIL